MKIKFIPSINKKERAFLRLLDCYSKSSTYIICNDRNWIKTVWGSPLWAKPLIKHRDDLINLINQKLIREIKINEEDDVGRYGPHNTRYVYELTNAGWHVLEILRLVDYINDIQDYKDMRCGDE